MSTARESATKPAISPSTIAYFHDNEDGLLGGLSTTGTLTINNSEFAFNGRRLMVKRIIFMLSNRLI